MSDVKFTTYDGMNVLCYTYDEWNVALIKCIEEVHIRTIMTFSIIELHQS